MVERTPEVRHSANKTAGYEYSIPYNNFSNLCLATNGVSIRLKKPAPLTLRFQRSTHTNTPPSFSPTMHNQRTVSEDPLIYISEGRKVCK
jgi:hypothetical protein